MPPHRDKDIEISKASLIAKRRALLKSLAEDSFHEFVRQAWAIVEPDVEYRDNWHIGALCDHLSAVNDGKIKQLLINVPPGAMKSLLVCVFWPAWVWAKSPAKRFLFASYSDGLTMRDSVRCRNILSSDWYQSNWPIKFKDDQNTKGLFENSQGGWRLSTSVGGKGTGLHPDVVCVYKDTLILTERGNIPIGPLVENRLPVKVVTWNEAMGTVEWKPILAYEKHVGRVGVKITTRGGRKLECTEEHPIYVSNKGTYIPAVDCAVGMVLITKSVGVVGDHGYDLIESIEEIPAPDHVYNLNVDGNHNYFANEILTHNCADDPNNAKEAESEADRQNVIDWWDGTISTRGVSRGVSQIVVQQRLHTMDLTGHLMGKGTWDHICLPMRYEADRMKTTSLGFQDPRGKDGELLWPDLFTEEMVSRLEKTMGIHHVAGQLQQRPAPRGGGMFKREWFDVLGYEPQFVRMVRFFDKAGCFVAGTMIRTPDGQKPIETMQSGDMVMTHVGPRRVKWAGMTNLATDLETVIFSNGATLTGTPDHPIKLTNGYWSRLDTVGGKDYCCAWPDNQTHCTSSLSLTESDTPEDLGEITTQPWCGTKNEKDTLPMPCTVPSTEACMGPSPVARISTTLTKTTIIIRLRILSASRGASICLSIGRNSRHLPILLSLRASVKKLLSGTVSIKKQTGIKKIARKEGRPRGGERRKRLLRALCAAAYTVVKHIEQAGSALINAKNGCVIGEGVPVYNMEVVGKHEYFANDILAHNTEGGKGARTAGVLMGRTEKGMFVILDVVKERLGAVEREALIKRMAIVDAQRYDGRVTTYVEQEPGSGGKESAEATVRNLAGFDCRIERVTGAKEVRAEPMAAQASVGNVKLLKGKWNEEFLDEIEVFPVGRLKDQCLVAGTMITTTRGQIPIERVTVEDMVLTREGFRRVLWAGMTNPAGVVFQMDLSTGGKLVGTANHPVWAIGRGWVDLANTEGAMVLGWCGPHRVERVQMQKLPMAVYNLTIFDVPEYYANDVLVHNCDAASGALNKLCEVSGAFGQVQAEMPAVAMPASETDFVHSDADFSSGDESFFGK